MDRTAVQEIIKEHELYVRSYGKNGTQMNLCDMDLSSMDLSNHDFTESVFTEVNFSNANLRYSEFDGCLGLWGSIFDGADMSFIKMRKANANEASFSDTIMINSELTRTTFYRATLSNIKMENSNLSEVEFVDCDLRNSDLRNTDLKLASIDRCKVNGIKLSGAKNLDSIFTEWIDIGANDIPLILTGDQAKEWLIRQAEM